MLRHLTLPRRAVSRLPTPALSHPTPALSRLTPLLARSGTVGYVSNLPRHRRGYASQPPGGQRPGGGFPGFSLGPQHQKGDALKEYVSSLSHYQTRALMRELQCPN
jgi:hypothetical protein